MKYLSIDIEATGLNEHDLIIEFAMVPFCSNTKTINRLLQKHYYIQCPSLEQLRPRLDPWVIEHNSSLIEKAHHSGISIAAFQEELRNYLESSEIKEYFSENPVKKIILFGKSLNAIDLPFLSRDLGWHFMRTYFHHQVHDLSSVVFSLIDKKIIPDKCCSGSELVKYMNMGEVAHTALEDAINTAKLYLELLEINQN